MLLYLQKFKSIFLKIRILSVNTLLNFLTELLDFFDPINNKVLDLISFKIIFLITYNKRAFIRITPNQLHFFVFILIPNKNLKFGWFSFIDVLYLISSIIEILDGILNISGIVYLFSLLFDKLFEIFLIFFRFFIYLFLLFFLFLLNSNFKKIFSTFSIFIIDISCLNKEMRFFPN